MLRVNFDHSIPLNEVAMLLSVGVSRGDPSFWLFHEELRHFIIAELTKSANTLNKMLIDDFDRAMREIWEFRNFPEYMKVMKHCLSRPEHSVVSRGKGGTFQIQYIDVNRVGGIEELRDAQFIGRLGRPSGTWEGWRGVYLSWREGRSKLYEQIIKQRFNWFYIRFSAPFLELVENGNRQYAAYPLYSGRHVLRNFRRKYVREIQKVYNNAMKVLSIWVAGRVWAGPVKYELVTMEIGGIPVTGFYWKSEAGKRIFVRAETIRYVRVGTAYRPYGSGFILRGRGVAKSFSGWLGKSYKLIKVP